jgi:phosphonoacetate hydrolase
MTMGRDHRGLGRREFLAGSLGSLVALGAGRFAPLSAQVRSPWDPSRKVLFMLVDGFGPEYLQQSEMPNLKEMMRAGMYVEGTDVIPSVTNVNNACLITGSFPAENGITGNYYYDPSTRQGAFMESPEYLMRPTLLDRARGLGIRSAFVTSKAKLLFLSQGADFATSAESPDADMARIIGPKQDVYSPDINYWSLRAARHFLGEGGCQLVYLATTDYMMHTYPPEDERSQQHLRTLDELLGRIANDHPGLELYLTADHGMSAKTDAIDVGRFMRDNSIGGEAVPIIRDRYIVHHNNLGGACYVYLDRPGDLEKMEDILRGLSGIEEIHRRENAAREFQLDAGRIGDLFVLAGPSVVFGDINEPREQVAIRSHGSRYESTVPIVCYGRSFDASTYRLNLDLTRNFAWEA